MRNAGYLCNTSNSLVVCAHIAHYATRGRQPRRSSPAHWCWRPLVDLAGSAPAFSAATFPQDMHRSDLALKPRPIIPIFRPTHRLVSCHPAPRRLEHGRAPAAPSISSSSSPMVRRLSGVCIVQVQLSAHQERRNPMVLYCPPNAPIMHHAVCRYPVPRIQVSCRGSSLSFQPFCDWACIWINTIG